MSNTAHIEEVSRKLGEPEWVLGWRKKHEELRKQLPSVEKYGIAIASKEVDLESMTSSIVPPAYRVDTIAKELELYTWREAVLQEEIAPLLRGLLESDLLPAPRTASASFVREAFADGLVVYAMPSINEDGTSREELLALETTVKGTAADLIVVIAKEGSKLKLKHHVRQDAGSTFLREVFVILEGDAEVTLIEDGEGEPHVEYFVSHTAFVPAHSKVSFTEIPWVANAYRSEARSLLIGEGAETTITHALVASAAGKGEGVYDIWSSVSHLADHTHSRVLVRGIGLGSSRTIYRGLIDMKEGVHKVAGAQDARFLMLSKDAEIDAIPSLDIASNEVSSSHKLSISHIRDIDLFYPKLRGYSEEEGKEVVIEGHFSGLEHVDEHVIMGEVRTLLGA